MADREAVKVIVRCRPMNSRENGLKCKNVVGVENKRAQINVNKPGGDNKATKNFTFDGTYGVDSDTSSIYDDIAYNLIEGVIEGYNGTIFAYGQTGCGKSFTMQGVPSQRGLIPRSFQHIFESISVTENTKFLVRASYLEIYNEEIRDLLAQSSKQKLELKENPDRGVYVKSLTHHQVTSVKECEVLMEKGWGNRSTGETLMNKDSSRSHSIFTIHVEAAEQSAESAASGDEEKIRAGKLNLVDLAGSERQSKTGATGARLKEATKINLSLSALGNVISALVDSKSKHIPYRDSKLTRMLQDSLGGNTKTLMVACISPADNNYDETLSTLRYANRAKNIQNKPKINEDPKDALLRQYQDEIKKLKEMLDGKEPTPAPSLTEVDSFDLEDERSRIRSELQRDFDEQVQTLKESWSEVQVANQNSPKPNEQPMTIQEQSANQLATERVVQQFASKMLVGGEESNNEKIKQRKQERKTHADKKRNELKRLVEDDAEDKLLDVYDNINDQIRQQSIIIDRVKQKNQMYKEEIDDLNEEFQDQREAYLKDIREQQLQIDLLNAILNKVQPTIRRDCNYYNLDRVKDECQFNGDSWVLPKLRLVKETLPNLSASPDERHHYHQQRRGPYKSRSNDRLEDHELDQQQPVTKPPPKPRPFKLRPLRP